MFNSFVTHLAQFIVDMCDNLSKRKLIAQWKNFRKLIYNPFPHFLISSQCVLKQKGRLNVSCKQFVCFQYQYSIKVKLCAVKTKFMYI